jgi:hypothetical protein
MNFKKFIATALLLVTLFSFPSNSEATVTIFPPIDDFIIELPIDDGLILYDRPPRPW